VTAAARQNTPPVSPLSLPGYHTLDKRMDYRTRQPVRQKTSALQKKIILRQPCLLLPL
jgi:hypothetical protein